MATKRLPRLCAETLPLPFDAETKPKTVPPAPLLSMQPLTVRISVAVRLTGIGRSKLYELIKAGELETMKIGGSTLIPYASLVRMIERAQERRR